LPRNFNYYNTYMRSKILNGQFWARAYFFLMPPDLADDEEEEEEREPELWEGLDPREELEIREELELVEGEE